MRSSRESSGSKRSSPDVRDVRPVPGADPGSLQTSEEQGASSGSDPERAGLEPALRGRGGPSSEPRRFSTCRGGPLRRPRLRDQSGERLDPHDHVERTSTGRRRGVEPRRTAEETRNSPERRPSEMCPPVPPSAEARPRRQEGGPGLRPWDSMPANGKGPEATRVADLIGRTPLLSLDRIAAHVAPGVRLFAKAEWLNPGGSVKDRAALGMLRAAQKAGLTKDRTLLEATSGNTGIAIATLAAAEGYRATLCVPGNISRARRRNLAAYGAHLVLMPPTEGTDGAQEAAKALVESEPRKFWYLDQYNNEANWRTHFETTGPEIWEQTRGGITHLVPV